MKKLSIGALVIMSIVLTACGESPEDKARKQMFGTGVKMMKEINEMSKNGASDEEISKAAIGNMVEGLAELEDEDGKKLSSDEKKKLKEGVTEGFGLMQDFAEKADENGGNDEDLTYNLLSNMAHMNAKYDDSLTDEEREAAQKTAEMFKDGGKKFKEETQKQVDKAKSENKK